MAEVIDIRAKRWESSRGDPADHDVVDALYAAIRAIESGDFAAEHVIVTMAKHAESEEENGVISRYYQSGSFPFFSQLGMLEEVKYSMLEDGRE